MSNQRDNLKLLTGEPPQAISSPEGMHLIAGGNAPGEPSITHPTLKGSHSSAILIGTVRVLLGLMVVFPASTLPLMGCGSRTAEPAENGAAPAAPAADPHRLKLTPEAVKYASLTEAEVIERELNIPVEATGQIALNEDRTAHVGALFQGRIREVLVKIGDRVRAGQELARMHTHEVHEARADYDQAQAELSRRKTEAAYAKGLLERAERLYQAKAGSLHEVERAKAEFQAAEQEVRRAAAQVERAIGHLEHLGLEEGKGGYDDPVIIRTPINGVIIKREVTPGAGITPGTPLFSVSDLSSLWALAAVSERHLPALRAGAPVTLTVAAYPETNFAGRIVYIGDRLDPETRTVQVRCLVENRAGKLKPEMYATVRLSVGEKQLARLVASDAIQEIDGQTVVFVARGEHEFEKRAVTLGRREGAMVEIKDGVTRGERVIAQGSFLLKSEFLKARFAKEE
jgi:cobalt-zinc-cadmium efflux system membrane fusion protein